MRSIRTGGTREDCGYGEREMVSGIAREDNSQAAGPTSATAHCRKRDALSSSTAPPYVEWSVPPTLAPYLVCAWRDKGAAPRGPVLPDACIDLLWDGAALHIAGPDTGPVAVAARRDIVGLRFRPGTAPAFLGIAAHELRDRRVLLADLWGADARNLVEQIATTTADPTAPLVAALVARLPTLAPPDPIVADLHRALRTAPTRIDRYADCLAVSERTLHRRALDALGYGPKTLARILRFRRALALGRAGLSPARIAVAAGYADQAHLSRECRRLAGITPASLFADRSPIFSSDW